MRKSLFFLGLTVLALTSCGGTTDDYSSDSSATEDVTATLNEYTYFTNAAGDQMGYLETETYYFETEMNDYANSGVNPSFICDFEIADREALEASIMDPQGLTDEEATDLKSQSTGLISIVDQSEKHCKELAKYATSQDYRSDDFAQGQTLVTQIYADIDSYYAAKSTISAAIDLLYEKYNTWAVDSSDPLSVGADNMGKDMATADAILTMVETAYTDDLFSSVYDLEISYNQFLSDVGSHSGGNSPAMESYYLSTYNDFYDTLDVSFLSIVNRTVYDMQNSDSEALSTDYYDLLDTYNVLVDSYNAFLDAAGY